MSSDRIQHYYNLYCQKLNRYGIQRQLNEGPVDFEKRIYDELTPLAETRKDIAFIFQAYRTLHYGNRSNDNLRRRYIKKIKTFKLRK